MARCTSHVRKAGWNVFISGSAKACYQGGGTSSKSVDKAKYTDKRTVGHQFPSERYDLVKLGERRGKRRIF
ncbi:hypothetical protein DBV15_06234 [Temnothorax longispinosus]|uniref:Uncharacterized protein n=1 Tax=Temnothorax longispinosus TaxID=300112 RepID=A0A4S2KVV1_9HYME|nr:hypothetical protein DBV15_06234 [Temnothorax longispinosus]